MTKPLPFTKAGLKRAIGAAQEAGLHVAGIKPDGTLVLSEEKITATIDPLVSLSPKDDADASSKWGDVEA